MNRRNFFNTFGKIASAILTIGVLPKQIVKSPVKVYKSAYKGSAFLEAGYIYAPYIPIYYTHTVMTKNGIFNI
jgi:hypothetical protein